jgi:HK97 family phage major capsid protein
MWTRKKSSREKNMITVDNRAMDEWVNVIAELESLDSQPGNLNKKQEQRHATLLAKSAGLRQGMRLEELRRWEQDRLLAAAGLPKLAESGRLGHLDEETENEWRAFGKGEPIRPSRVPKDSEVRANEAGTQALTFTQQIPGGAFVPQGMYARAFESMKQHDQIFDPQFSNIVETDTGNNMPFPVWDDVTNQSVQVGETTQSNEVDVAAFASTQLNAYAFRSKIVGVSLELLQDSNFPIGAVLERVFAMRHARGVGQALINGSGVASPTGLTTAVLASGASPVIAAGSSSNTGGAETGATSIGTQDINTLYHKLDNAYRSGAAFYMNDATLSYLEGLLDQRGRPLVKFTEGLTGQYGICPYIHGKPVCISPSIPAMASAKNSVFFGQPMNFVQRRVPSSMYVRRFWQNPSLVQFGLVGFESWLRVDSGLVAPNQQFLPFQLIQQHS